MVENSNRSFAPAHNGGQLFCCIRFTYYPSTCSQLVSPSGDEHVKQTGCNAVFRCNMAIADSEEFTLSLAYVHQMDVGQTTGSGSQAFAQQGAADVKLSNP